MALRFLILATLAGFVAANSVSHVSFSFGNQAPITYEVRPDHGHPPSPPPRPRYPTPAPPKYTSPPPPPIYTTPAPPRYPTTPARAAYTPPQLTTAPAATYPPLTTPAPKTYAPIYEPTTTPAPTYAPTAIKAPIYHNLQPAYQPRPSYQPRPAYQPRPFPSYNPAPSYQPAPTYGPSEPACAALTNSTWCLEDEEYPEYEIKHAIEYHLDKFNSLYADVAELDTQLSVERPMSLEEETYLCPSETAYVRPLRAQNTDGVWRVVVNNVHLHYKTFTQTTRIEECLTAGEECPKVPMCYESKCLQKSIYHRFLVYDPYDKYFPFAIESFKLPASCACLLGAYTIDH